MLSCCRTNIEFDDLLARWDRRGEAIPFDELKEEIGQLALSRDDFEEHIRFDESRYQRVLIHRTPAYEVLVLCWRSGQRSLIHDHAGSACVLRILEGSATETSFDRGADGRLAPTESHTASAGTLCASFDADIHQIANLEPAGHDLITLHVYSPPLSQMRTYSIAETTLAPFEAQIAASHEAMVGASISRVGPGRLEPAILQGI